MGKFKANISINNEEKQAEFLGVNTKCGSLLGCKTATQLKILHIGPGMQTINAVKIENDFQKKYPELENLRPRILSKVFPALLLGFHL